MVAWDKPEGFRGRAALERRAGRRASPGMLVGLATEGRQPPRAGAAVLVDGEPVGEVTSGNFSPVLGHGIALALRSPPDVAGGERGRASTSAAGRSPPAAVPLPFVAKKKG